MQALHNMGCDWIIMDFDATKLDFTVTPELETLVVDTLFIALNENKEKATEVCEMLRRKSYRVVCDEGYLRFYLRCARASGTQRTGIANTLIMWVLNFAYLKRLGARGWFRVDGDDGNMVIERRLCDPQDFAGFFREFGIVLEVEPPTTDRRKSTFCQSRVVSLRRDYHVMVRNPRVVLSRDGMTYRDVGSKREWLDHLTAVGMCGMSVAAGVPILQSYYHLMLRLGGGSVFPEYLKAEYYRLIVLSKGLSCTDPVPITEYARFTFWQAYDISPEAQRALEQLFDRCTFSGLAYLTAAANGLIGP